MRFSGRFIEYLLERPDVKDVWRTFTHHPFVMAMGNGTLPLESFKGYLVQDYLYLVRMASPFVRLATDEASQVHFARANALASYKAKSMQDITAVRPHPHMKRPFTLMKTPT